jgi:hypothetical protein
VTGVKLLLPLATVNLDVHPRADLGPPRDVGAQVAGACGLIRSSSAGLGTQLSSQPGLAHGKTTPEKIAWLLSINPEDVPAIAAGRVQLSKDMWQLAFCDLRSSAG